MRVELLAVAIVATFANGARAQTAVPVPPSGDLRVTVYEGGRALFSEHRRATVAAGMNELELTGMPSGIADALVDIQAISGPALRVTDQQLIPAAERAGKALAALVGQTISLVRHEPNGDQVTQGTLLNVTASGAVGALQVGDRVVLDPAGEVQVTPEQLALLTRTTTLVARVQSDAAGEAELLVSYLVGDTAWEAQHSIVLSEDAATMSLASWVMVRINSAAGLTAASLRLVSGNFASPAGVQAYDPGRGVSFGLGGVARLSLANAPRVPITNLLLFDGGTLEALAAEKPIEGPVLRVTRFEDGAASGLGVPIPLGKATIYQKTQGGTRLVSQATMPPAKDGVTVDLALGEVGGLRATSRQASWRQLSPEDIERKCETVIANGTGTAQTVTCGVTMAGQWKIAEASHAYAVRPGDRVEFSVPVTAEQKRVTLTYTVRIQVGSAGGEVKGGEAAPPVPAPKNPEE